MFNIEIKNNKDYGLVVSSRTIASELGKEHKTVLRELDNTLKSDGTDLYRQIIKSEYKNERGKKYREYLLTEKGFTLYMFNIQGYNDFKMAYINEFERMKDNQQKPLTSLEQIQLLAQGTSELNERIETVEDEITDIRENTKLDAGEYGAIAKAVSNKVAQIRYSMEIDKGNKKANKELFQDINTEIKRVAGVSTRSQLKQKDFENVMELIRLWQPSQSTVFLIKK